MSVKNVNSPYLLTLPHTSDLYTGPPVGVELCVMDRRLSQSHVCCIFISLSYEY
jgi:hypothetical protein